MTLADLLSGNKESLNFTSIPVHDLFSKSVEVPNYYLKARVKSLSKPFFLLSFFHYSNRSYTARIKLFSDILNTVPKNYNLESMWW